MCRRSSSDYFTSRLRVLWDLKGAQIVGGRFKERRAGRALALHIEIVIHGTSRGLQIMPLNVVHTRLPKG